MKIAILKIAGAVLSAIYAILKLFPQDKKRIVFISRQGDSPNMDFLLLNEQLGKDMPDFNTVMLCKKFVVKGAGMGKKLGYLFHILRQTWHIARARVVLLDTYCIPVSMLKHRKSLLVIQLWHSIGSMKKIGYAAIGTAEGTTKEMAEAMHMHRGYDYVMISSMGFVKDLLEGFDITIDKMVEIPLPKADVITDKALAAKRRQEIMEEYHLDNGKKNILYCPTFRKDGGGVSRAAKAIYDAIDHEKYNFIFQPHPIDRAEDMPEGIVMTTLPTFEAIFASDYVISDYSSVIYEAGLAGKPIFAYAYDWEDYSAKREINFDIKNDFPGIFSSDAREVIRAIETEDFDMQRQREFLKRNVTMPEGKSCAAAIADFIKTHLK